MSEITAASILENFNLITTGNVSTQSDIEGSAIIGGNLNGATFFNANAPGNPVIYLYGADNTQSLNIGAGGSLYMNGSPGSNDHVNLNGGGHLYTSGPPNTLASYTTPLANLSAQLGAVASNSTITVTSNTVTFNAVAASNGVAVFTISLADLQSDLSNGRVINFNLGSKVTGVVVNVTGSGSFTDGANWNGSPLRDVIFNFESATSVTVGNWEASILAPKASVGISGGALNGSVFAKSFVGGGELHNYTFDGTLPCTCFLRGTHLATPGGETEITALRAGDLVATRIDGKTIFQPVTWIGFRAIELRAMKDPAAAYPVRIRAGAFGHDVPHRDLLVTPEHCILVGGKLIPARMLVNGSSIVTDASFAEYEYFHVELARHSILVAEGLETESYLDTGNRGNFANAPAPALRPALALNALHQSWENDAAAPLAVDRETVEPIWQQLADRASRLGLACIEAPAALTDSPDLRLVTQSGQELRPIVSDGRFHGFAVPRGT